MNSFFKSLYLVFLILSLLACQKQKGLKEQYNEIKSAASVLSGANVFNLDSSKSAFDWEISGDSGRFLKGTFSPEKGSLVFQNGLIVAGFWSGNFWKREIISDHRNLDLNHEARSILDSTARLHSESGKTLKFELLQSSRYVLRSDYRNGINPGTDTSSTHVLTGNLTLADSTLSVTLPVKMSFSPQEINIQGSYSVNYPDFGIGHRPENMYGKLVWSRSFPVRFRLVFRAATP